MIDITGSYTYLLLVYLGDDAFETLWNFFLWHVSSFYSSHSKHAMPFQHQHSFYWEGNFMSTCSRHRLDLCHCQLTHEREHLFLLKSNNSCFCNVSACAWGFIEFYSCNPIKLSTFASHDWALQIFWAPLDSREASSRCPFFFAHSVVHFEDLKVCINSFPKFPCWLLNWVRIIRVAGCFPQASQLLPAATVNY